MKEALAKRPLVALLLVEAALVTWLVASGRIVRGHDGLQYLTLQYWFLGQAAAAGEVPRWMPFMTHGTVSNWWFAVSGGFVQSALTLVAPLFEGRDFVPVFWLGIFFDYLLLLTGSWLLARRHQTPLAATVTCVTVAGSVAVTQPWFTLHLWYALPLILELLHRAWDDGRWRWLALAGNLLAVQTFGGLPYFIPVASFAIFLYAVLAMAAAGRARTRERLLALWRAPHLAKGAAIAAALVPLAASFALLKLGTSEILDNSPGRSAGGSVPLPVFVAYGSRPDTGWDANWLAFLLSGTRTLDFFGYHGILALPLAGFAVCRRPDRRLLAWLAGGVLILGFCNGTVISVVAWLAWPAMRWYRHLGLASSLAGVWLAFMAGFGIDALRSIVLERDAGAERVTRRLAMAIVATAALLPIALTQWDRLAYTIASALVARADWSSLHESLVLGAAASAAVAVAGALLVLRLGRRAEHAAAALLALVGLHAADVYGVRITELARRTWVVPEDAREHLRLTAAPWRPARAAEHQPNDRASAFQPLLEKVTQEETAFGVVNWSMDSFLFRDSLDSEYRVDHWLVAYDDLLRACAGQDLEDRGLNPSQWRPYAAYRFPTTNCPAHVLAGVEGGKLRVFREAVPLRTERDVARALQRPGYDGSALFVLDPAAPAMVTGTAAGAVLAGVEPHVDRFTANSLDVTVSAPDGGWLYYADAFHPGWEAAVNGTPVAIRRANLAYKAVPLVAGENHVAFRFAAPWVKRIFAFAGLEALAWIGITLAFLRAALRRS